MATGPGARRGAWRPLASVVVAAGFLLAACGSSEFAFIQSNDRKAFFKVPVKWHAFNRRQLLVASGQSLSPATDANFPWLVAFDGSPQPSVDNILRLEQAPDHPVVLAQMQRLDFSARDQISLGSIRNQVYPVDDLLEQDAADIIDYEELVLDDGFHGIRIVYDVITQGANRVAADNDVIRVHQIGILDPQTEHLYLFTIRCESHCFRDFGPTIDQIADSWTVKEQ